jgi:hypothetical protein
MMRFSPRIRPSKADFPRLRVWIFCITWLVGNIALIIGLNGDRGEVPAAFIFAIACLAWAKAYRLSGAKSLVGNAIGFLAFSIWMLNLGGAFVFDYRHYVPDFFFWTSTVLLLLLIISVTLFEARIA